MELSIGQVAAAGSVNVQTIRYYERRGLLSATRRTSAGYRQYSDEAVTRLRFIRHAQELGFSLGEIEELLALRVRNGASCRAAEQRTRTKLEGVRRRIQDLKRMERTLERLARACESRRVTDSCPILQALGDDHASD